jgi:hypothetical protein
MAEDGVVGQYNGAQARDVLISLEEWESRNHDDHGTTAGHGQIGVADDPVRASNERALIGQNSHRRNKIVPEPDDGEAASAAGPNDEDYEQAELDEEELDEEEWDEEDDEELTNDESEADEEDDSDEEFEDEDDELEEESIDEEDESESIRRAGRARPVTRSNRRTAAR